MWISWVTEVHAGMGNTRVTFVLPASLPPQHQAPLPEGQSPLLSFSWLWHPRDLSPFLSLLRALTPAIAGEDTRTAEEVPECVPILSLILNMLTVGPGAKVPEKAGGLTL